jgi:hypothetical protein
MQLTTHNVAAPDAPQSDEGSNDDELSGDEEGDKQSNDEEGDKQSSDEEGDKQSSDEERGEKQALACIVLPSSDSEDDEEEGPVTRARSKKQRTPSPTPTPTFTEYSSSEDEEEYKPVSAVNTKPYDGQHRSATAKTLSGVATAGDEVHYYARARQAVQPMKGMSKEAKEAFAEYQRLSNEVARLKDPKKVVYNRESRIEVNTATMAEIAGAYPEVKAAGVKTTTEKLLVVNSLMKDVFASVADNVEAAHLALDSLDGKHGAANFSLLKNTGEVADRLWAVGEVLSVAGTSLKQGSLAYSEARKFKLVNGESIGSMRVKFKKDLDHEVGNVKFPPWYISKATGSWDVSHNKSDSYATVGNTKKRKAVWQPRAGFKRR